MAVDKDGFNLHAGVRVEARSCDTRACSDSAAPGHAT
jgi:hypothetical protein